MQLIQWRTNKTILTITQQEIVCTAWWIIPKGQSMQVAGVVSEAYLEGKRKALNLGEERRKEVHMVSKSILEFLIKPEIQRQIWSR